MTRRRTLTALLLATLAALLLWPPQWGQTPFDSSTRPTDTPPPRTDEGLIRRTKEQAREAQPPQRSPFLPPVADTPVVDTGLDTEVPPDEVLVELEIIDTDGYPVDEAALAMRGDCGRRTFRVTDGEGEMTIQPGECRFTAWRQDGALRTFSETLDFLLDPGDGLQITLVLPSERTGGLGVQIQPHDQGMQVMMVVPGSPAERSGLQAGDIITEVDGTPASILSMQDFVQVMTGPEGTDVDFVVEYDGDTGIVAEPIVVTRAFLEG